MADRIPRIVVAEKMSESAMERLRAVGEVVVLDRCDETLREMLAGSGDAKRCQAICLDPLVKYLI